MIVLNSPLFESPVEDFILDTSRNTVLVDTLLYKLKPEYISIENRHSPGIFRRSDLVNDEPRCRDEFEIDFSGAGETRVLKRNVLIEYSLRGDEIVMYLDQPELLYVEIIGDEVE